MDWPKFGTAVATAVVGIGTWTVANKAIGDIPNNPTLGVVARVVATLAALFIYVYVVNRLAPTFFCPAQVAVPATPPVQEALPAAPPAAGGTQEAPAANGGTSAK